MSRIDKMVTIEPERQSPLGDPGRDKASEERPQRSGPLVAFDFDGTMTVRDSFKAFLRWRVGGPAYSLGMVRLIPSLLAYPFHRSRARLKTAMVRIFLKGLPRKMLEREAAEFAAATAAPGLLRPDALKAWRRYRLDGARLVIVTASPEQLVAPFARGLGADLLLATRLDFDADDRLSGRLDGRNCRSQEKVRRLREAFGQDIRLAAAYGDTAGDIEMLDLADEKFMRLFTAKPTNAGGALT
jgi:phosphatidylglycerophosphatase C